MSEKLFLQGVISDIAGDLADKTEAREAPLVRIDRPRTRCTEIIHQMREGEVITDTERLSINALTAWVLVKNNLQERTVVECLKD